MQAATALCGLNLLGSITAIGPADAAAGFQKAFSNVRWMATSRPDAFARILKGRAQHRSDSQFGQDAANKIRALAAVQRCYGFTQVSLEAAAWCRDNGKPFALDNPNGHIRNVRAVYQRESWRWCSAPFLGHPTSAMVARVEEEYRLATSIRVSSEFSKATMVDAGVPAQKIDVIPQFLDLERFRRPPARPFGNASGPLRMCFVGSLDLRKGFVYLLRAIRKVGPEKVTLRIIGNTGDPWCKRLFNREAKGLDVAVMPGDPVPSYHWAEVSVTPSLEDGFGFVVAEAMAAGVPVIVTDRCGAAEWVEHNTSGWVVPFTPTGSDRNAGLPAEDALAEQIERALENRTRLAEMGTAGVEAAWRRGHERNASLLASWFDQHAMTAAV